MLQIPPLQFLTVKGSGVDAAMLLVLEAEPLGWETIIVAMSLTWTSSVTESSTFTHIWR